jgi:hypothetical protein
MKKSTILAGVAGLVILSLTMCSPRSPTGPIPPDIAIKGTWLTWFGGIPYVMTVNNTSIDYTNSGIGGTITKYNNIHGYCVVYWDQHPAYALKYQKLGWTNLTATNFFVIQYAATNSAVLAETSTLRWSIDPATNWP